MISANKSLLLSALLIGLTACGPSGTQKPFVRNISASTVLASDATPQEKAEQLADDAEVLVSNTRYTEALNYTELALKEDSSNVRAGLIRALVKPMILQKGLYRRTEYIKDFNYEIGRSYTKVISDIYNSNVDLGSYLIYDNTPRMQTETEFQAHLDQTIEALDELRVFLKNNADKEIKIRMIAPLITNPVDRYVDSCELTDDGQGNFQLTCPEEEQRFYVKLNKADFENLRSMTSYFQIYMTLLSAYDMTGFLKKTDKQPYSSVTKSNQQMFDDLISDPSFGRLRDKNRLKGIKTIGVDLVAGLNWAMANFNSLCPKGQEDGSNRIGMLFNRGYCVNPFLKTFTDAAEIVLAGNKAIAPSEFNGKGYEVQHQGILLFTNPMKDFRNLGPLKFNNCNLLASAGDNSLNGTLPNGDFNTILGMSASSCQ